MKHFLLVLLASCCMVAAHGQNLVPNPGFEEFIRCPQSHDNIDYDTSTYSTLKDWSNPLTASYPDYFNVCATIPEVSIPANYFSSNTPTHSGNGYAGITNYESLYLDDVIDGIEKKYSEYIMCKLLRPMKAGYRYDVSFYVIYSRKAGIATNYVAVDKVGAYFSKNAVHETGVVNDVVLKLNPQVESPAGGFINDTTKWVKVSGVYTAAGGEQWLTLGTFYNTDVNTELLFPAQLQQGIVMSHMFVDDVAVTAIDCDTIYTTHNIMQCDTTNVVLTRTEAYEDYRWNTGDTTASITVNNTGTYWRISKQDCETFIDTFHVRYLSMQGISPVTDTLSLCTGSTTRIGMPHDGMQYKWNTGATECCILPTVSGLYTRIVTNGCDSLVDSFNVTVASCKNCLIIPDVFSPNNDGLNDKFNIRTLCPLDKYVISIYNRWGENVFSSNSLQQSWDGTYKGKEAPVGVYYYMVLYNKAGTPNWHEEIKKGNVTVVR